MLTIHQRLQVAHERGLGVHPYTFRNEGRYMALDFNNDIVRPFLPSRFSSLRADAMLPILL